MTMSHRQHIEMRELRELRRQGAKELAQREAARLEAEQKPLLDAQAEFANTFKEYLQVRRQNIEAGLPDSDFQIDPDAPVWFATQAEAAAHNKRVGEEFVRLHPEYYASPQNLNALDHYLKAQGIDKIISLTYLEKAFTTLSELGMLEERPAEPAPEPEPIPTSPRTERAETAPASEPEPAGEWGWSEMDGKPLFLTSYQVSRLDSESYKRFRRIGKDELDLARLVRR